MARDLPALPSEGWCEYLLGQWPGGAGRGVGWGADERWVVDVAKPEHMSHFLLSVSLDMRHVSSELNPLNLQQTTATTSMAVSTSPLTNLWLHI